MAVADPWGQRWSDRRPTDASRLAGPVGTAASGRRGGGMWPGNRSSLGCPGASAMPTSPSSASSHWPMWRATAELAAPPCRAVQGHGWRRDGASAASRRPGASQRCRRHGPDVGRARSRRSAASPGEPTLPNAAPDGAHTPRRAATRPPPRDARWGSVPGRRVGRRPTRIPVREGTGRADRE